jgi:hypothetical protein
MKNYADQAVADYVAESVLERDPQWMIGMDHR